MKLSLKNSHRSGFCLLILFLHEFLTSCSLLYRGPCHRRTTPDPGGAAGIPTGRFLDLRKLGNGTHAKSTRLYSNQNFPLWIGKAWRYEIEVRRGRFAAKQYGFPLAWTGRLRCKAVDRLTVRAGTFEAFRCECDCELLIGEGQYQSGCGTWTIWYAPDIKNVHANKNCTHLYAIELIEYKYPNLPPVHNFHVEETSTFLLNY